MGIFDWLFGGKKTTTPEKKETIVKETVETIKKPLVKKPAVKTVKNIFNNISLKNAVQEWVTDNSKTEKKYGHISDWDVSNVTDMYELFRGLKSFNDDISKWNVSNVTDMCEMFSSAYSFNQDISNWNVIKVENMSDMFNGAESFKQDLSKWNLKGMEGATEYIVEYLNSYSTKKIIIDKKTKKQLKERGRKVIELMINDIKIKTTIKKFETAEKNNFNGFYDYDDDYNLELSDDFEEVCMFLNEITNEKLIVRAEYWAEDSEIGGIGIEEVSYLNCECPDNLKKYYNGELFITDGGKMLETKSDGYKKINFDEIWENAEITNSGVICAKFDD